MLEYKGKDEPHCQNVVLLFGGANAERLVSVASAQNLLCALPTPLARLWFWAPDGTIHLTDAQRLSEHQDPFTKPFEPASSLSWPWLGMSMREFVCEQLSIALTQRGEQMSVNAQ